jgi:hypothetical protein
MCFGVRDCDWKVSLACHAETDLILEHVELVGVCRRVYALPSLAPWIVAVCENLHFPREPFSWLYQSTGEIDSPKVQSLSESPICFIGYGVASNCTH